MAINDELLKALGRITVNFQALEMHLNFLTWMLMGTEQEVGQIVTAQLPFNRILDLCSSLILHRVKDLALIDKVEHILRRASDIEGKRNQLVHSGWVTGDSDATKGFSGRFKYTARRKKGLHFQFENMGPTEVNATADSIKSLSEDVVAIMIQLAASNGSGEVPQQV